MKRFYRRPSHASVMQCINDKARWMAAYEARVRELHPCVFTALCWDTAKYYHNLGLSPSAAAERSTEPFAFVAPRGTTNSTTINRKGEQQ